MAIAMVIKYNIRYINLVQDVYSGSSIKSMYGVTEYFNVCVGVYHESVLIPYLFTVVMHRVTKELQGEIPRCMMYADDIVLGEENLKVNNRLDEWRLVFKGKRLSISRSETEYTEYEFRRKRQRS